MYRAISERRTSRVRWFRSGALIAAGVLAASGMASDARRPAASSTQRPSQTVKPQIGVYYFPGWEKSDWGPAGKWKPIEPYADRKPMLGWYDLSDRTVMAKQLKWMADYGVDFVVMDWYYSQGTERLTEGLDAYLAAKQSKVKLSLMWANHDEPTTPDIFRSVVKTWIDKYLRNPNFLKKDGRPVAFIFSYDKLTADAKSSGVDLKSYIDMAQQMTKAAGLPPIYFVACVDDTSMPSVRDDAVRVGFSAVSAYQFHRKPQSAQAQDPEWGRPTHGWAELAKAYQVQWDAARRLPIPLIVPMISGLDRTPWGGFGSDKAHDLSIATPDQFSQHLLAARRFMAEPGAQQSNLGVVCCWNEYGEGPVIEPTTHYRYAYLERIKKVFSSK